MTLLTVPSIADLIERDKVEKAKEQNAEIASTTMLQQQMMENSGKLRQVIFVGPEQSIIQGYFSEEENTFLPKFEMK